jgi:hypothetical protein
VSALVLECRTGSKAMGGAGIPAGVSWVRLRPDRGLAIVFEDGPGHAARWAREVEDANPGMLVVDVSAGWAAFAVPHAAKDRWAALTSMWPDGSDARARAGLVAGVPAVVVPNGAGVVILVGASHAHHLAGELGLGAPVTEPAQASEVVA